MGLAWPHAVLKEKKVRSTERLLLAGPYLIAISCVCGAIFGTSRATPIAGAGFVGERWQEILVSVGLGIGSIASLIAVYALLLGFVRRQPGS
jgi:hydroxylaminobenzene mutase